ncbi:tRNA (adenosine(37)-N6)-threonylcarbamoyltransferase complex dimerization subunit type 1 TsaB [Bifidobacterium mongoliense]|uniref:tRNA threonylcarbamoyladenosine biosynthesis protein TsaB n=2 Tax=Bifidobacterium mongoliense TaxID=518643 RepID=A0A423UBR8_9BIFI|nr:tRNA (adenosine(37)-N6)-threonylcarbamoyltransferase complex dimerization subunit type 1 TsaB [Bifidobacterium mongoliense]KFI76773.1 putative metal-dependent proteases-like protein [Bifidobacterium mongoliense DSM 21395]ROT86149.1 tRNA threonylcarbamoyladenosine biosynthesis protein TsaB [Bifidobacterium mongoliense]
MTNTLVIDTSYGSTVGVVGHDPIVETNSRTHVERLQVDIAKVVADAGLAPGDLDRIVVGVGPGPYTGLRAGIVAAKAISLATGAALVGTDILTPQARMADAVRGLAGALAAEDGASTSAHPAPEPDTAAFRALTSSGDGESTVHLTLAVNDARRRQLYFALFMNDDLRAAIASHAERGGEVGEFSSDGPLIGMDIDYPDHLVGRVQAAIATLPEGLRTRVVVDIIGHGAERYASLWRDLGRPGAVVDSSVLDMGAWGLALFADSAGETGTSHAVEPLYLRRPDVSVPNPLKHVLKDGPRRGDDRRPADQGSRGGRRGNGSAS